MKKMFTRFMIGFTLSVMIMGAVIHPQRAFAATDQQTTAQDQQTTEKKENKNAHSGHGH